MAGWCRSLAARRCPHVDVVAVLSAGPADAAAPTTAAARQDLKARCAQLVAYYDRYGASRSSNSDGRSNHTRIGVEIECDRGLYAKGIAAMKDLLRTRSSRRRRPGRMTPRTITDADEGAKAAPFLQALLAPLVASTSRGHHRLRVGLPSRMRRSLPTVRKNYGIAARQAALDKNCGYCILM